MKIGPILYQGEMVRATLDDRKSQTRRVIKPQPPKNLAGYYFDAYDNGPFWNFWGELDNKMANGIQGAIKNSCQWKCPYGVPGDRLWVRETWRLWDSGLCGCGGDVCGCPPDGTIMYAAVEPHAMTRKELGPWHPSIFMPRKHSRLTLEIVKIRGERVQDITEEDAKAEGCPVCIGLSTCGGSDACHGCPSDNPKRWFRELWNSINAKPKPVKKWPDLPADPGNIIAYVSYPWDESSRDPRTEISGKPHICYPNPWVWALTFKKVANES